MLDSNNQTPPAGNAVTPSPRTRLPIVALLIANALSLVGSALTAIAVPWFVLQTTGSATQMGVTAFFTALPTIVASFFGGALADRLGYRRVSVAADVTSGLAVAAIPLFYHLFGLAFWQLLLLVFMRGLCNAPGNTARTALVPDLAELAQIRLERATAAFEAIQRASVLLGAPLAGVLIGFFSPSTVLWGDAASFLVSATLVACLVRVRATAPQADTPGRYLGQVVEGLRYLWTDRLILTILAMALITNLLDAALGSVVIPVYVNRFFGSALALGLINAAVSAGALAGTLVFLTWGHSLPKRITLTATFTIAGLRAWVLAPSPPLPLILGAMAVIGLAVAQNNPLLITTVYRRIPADMRARVLGALIAGVSAGVPLGGLLGGSLIAAIGLRPTLVLIGTCYLLTTLSLLVNPAGREMDA